MAVAWNRIARGASRNEPSKTRKAHSALGRVQYMDSYTDVYEIIAHIRVIHMRVCIILHHFRFAIKL